MRTPTGSQSNRVLLKDPWLSVRIELAQKLLEHPGRRKTTAGGDQWTEGYSMVSRDLDLLPENPSCSNSAEYSGCGC